jgi:zinc protease
MSRTIDRGTAGWSADDIAERLDGRGVTLSTAAGRHVLSLACTCLVEDFEDVLALLGEIVMRPAFPEAEVERRRGEIVTLIRQDEDNPATVSSEALQSLLYGAGHPYVRRARGTVETAARIDGDALRRSHARCCAPSVLSLACVGDIEPDRAVEGARSVFGARTDSVPPPPAPAPAPRVTTRRTRVIPMMNKAQTDIAYGFAAVARTDPAYHAYWLMNNILGQYSLGGRLGDSIRERQGMAYHVSSSLEAGLLPGPLVIRAGVGAANVTRAVASIDAELAKLVELGPTEQELVESKQYLTGSIPRTLETNMGIATYLQTVELFGLGLDYDVRVPDLLGAVTLGDVHTAARRVLDPAKATIVVAGPFEGSLT